MADEALSDGVDLLLFGAGALAAIGGTSPLWWQSVLTKYCRDQKGLLDTSCVGVFADVVEGCRECQSYGASVAVPLLVAFISALVFVAKLKDAVSF